MPLVDLQKTWTNVLNVFVCQTVVEQAVLYLMSYESYDIVRYSPEGVKYAIGVKQNKQNKPNKQNKQNVAQQLTSIW